MKLKLFLLLIGCFFLCGCSINYNLIINDDFSVNEQMNLDEKEEIASTYDNSFVIQRMEFEYKNSYPKYKFKDIANASIFETRVTRQYVSLSDYKDSTSVFKALNINYDVLESGNNVYIDINIPENLINKVYYLNNFIKPDKIYISINLPFKVINQNAIQVENNKYTWVVNPNNKSTEIYLTYDKTKKSDTFYMGNLGLKYTVIIAIIILALLFSAAFVLARILKENRKI